ncbi:hypothetical protein BU24DRAFT_452403 [Aaosphaeria arxii CBS 175.79]|uniref:Peptidase metallopeptidase domain-containing protein n=1 Tax=Aaosphaeria arxii CBS 175.79 TaxID=1450172 RepID=A0A6A5XKP9_9PLEO|nr:uncharacterized protein BU24DRAFT_452403 [Aaosphaeria arxii CBS 175.79]KAF2013533.1 hypothetical protein BU24DRAFT_452403 [Aaosphaeria arxii CBS 175.79]
MKIPTTVAYLLCTLSLANAASPDRTEKILARTLAVIPSSSPTLDPTWRQNRTRQAKHIHDFFKLFGWLRRNDTIRDPDMPRAIRKIQRVLREPETGVYDERMETVMSRPQCATVQPYNESDAIVDNSTMHKRYVLWGPKWDRTALTYRFVNYTADLSQDRQRAIISAAFDKWMAFLPLTITQASTSTPRADIHIRFISLGAAETGYAYTNMIADGLTMSSGLINVTFNDDYNWADDRLFNFTAVHEIGHALGLSHSKVESAIMWPYYDGIIRPMHPDDTAAIHTLYGWKDPRWNRIDTNSGTKDIIQVSTPLENTASALDGLYQLRSSGQVLSYTPSSNAWKVVDSNKDTAQIAGAGGNIYQRHTDGSVYRYSGTGSNWQYIGAPSDNVVDIVAASDQIYVRRKDGWVARWSGNGLIWTTIEKARNSKQIAVTDQKTIWNLLTNGDLVRSTWPYGSGWTIVDVNPLNTQIVTGGTEFYKLQSDGLVVWLESVKYYWVVIDDEGDVVSVFAVGIYIYARRADGSIWRYTGTPHVWEQLDDRETSASVVGDRKGAVWEMLGGGDVFKLVS